MVDLTPNIVAAWHLNSASGNVAIDASPNDNDGTLVNMEDGDWVAGKLNNCLQFDGANEYVNCHDIANFDRTDLFSIELWLKTSMGGWTMLLNRENSIAHIGWTVSMGVGSIMFRLNNSWTNRLQVQTVNNTFNDDSWHHVIVTYDGSSIAAGVNIYVDNVNQNKNVISDTLIGSTLVNVNCIMGASNVITYDYIGLLDEVVIYDKELSVPEVAQRWNGGVGTEHYGQIPPTISNPDPNNGATGITYNQNLNWDSNGVKWDIYFGTSSSPPLIKSNHPSSDWTIPYNLDSCTKYYWKIKAYSSWEDSFTGAEWDFTTGNEPPVTPHTPAPVHGATGQNLDVTISWDSEDYNPNDSLVYDIYFGTTSSPPLVKSNHGSKSYTVSGLTNEQPYYWKIVAKDNASCGIHNTTSPIWKFTTKSIVTGGYESFDPRKAFRDQLASLWNVNKDCDELEKCIYITDSKGDRVYVPMYLSEEVKSEQLPALPFLELEIPPGGTTYEPQDILASTRKMESFILIHIYFTDMDNIDRTEFAKKIKDRLHDLTRYYQSSTAGIVFMNIEDDGLEEETDGKRVVFHYIATLYCLYYDTCVEP